MSSASKLRLASSGPDFLSAFGGAVLTKVPVPGNTRGWSITAVALEAAAAGAGACSACVSLAEGASPGASGFAPGRREQDETTSARATAARRNP